MREKLSHYGIFTATLIFTVLFSAVPAFAQTGGFIFGDAACALISSVMAQNYGAMITVIAGGLAIITSITGNFRGAWALIFVSVGAFVLGDLVETFHPILNCGGGPGLGLGINIGVPLPGGNQVNIPIVIN